MGVEGVNSDKSKSLRSSFPSQWLYSSARTPNTRATKTQVGLNPMEKKISH